MAIALTAIAGSAMGQTTTRVSVSSSGVQSNAASFRPAISADGRFVSFSSSANNLVPGDTNGVGDVFVHDLQTGITERISLSSSGEQANASSSGPAISGDGRYVAFTSSASNLVPGVTNGVGDVYVHDRQTGQTTRVSVSSTGEEANSACHTAAISTDGRIVAFQSAATNLVPGITNSVWDIFVHDRETGETSRVSVSSTGGQSNGDSQWASLSDDGRFVSFTSQADTLVPGPTNMRTDVYVRDRQTGQTTRVSVSSDGQLGNDNSLGSAISGDGRFVVFSSFAGNLDPNDSTASEDIFVHDRQTAQTKLVSVSSSGVQANSWSFWPTISGDGRWVAFVSDASNLVPDDTNGRRDVFMHDLLTSTTTRVSVSSDGDEGDHNSGFFAGPSLSGDGRFVAFESMASNLVEDDTNGVNDAFVHDRDASAPTNPADLNGDGAVDVSDLLILLANWGQCPRSEMCIGDINGDGTVDVSDLLILLANWG